MTPSLFPKIDFEMDSRIKWFMHCAEGPVPKAGLEAIRHFLIKEGRPWEVDFKTDFVDLTEKTREQAALLMGAASEDISLTSTTSSGLILVAQGINWEAGDEVLIPVGEFPSNIWPWKALESQGVKVRMVPLWEGHKGGSMAMSTLPPGPECNPEEILSKAITDKTKVVSVSWVRFQDGLKLDLEKLGQICKKRGVYLVVDGIQGAGTCPLPDPIPDGMSAFATGGHKGLLTPQGSGFLWTRSDLRKDLKPLGSWLSVEEALNFQRPNSDVDRNWNTDGTYLEQGVPNQIGCLGFQQSLHYLNGFSANRIQNHIYTLQGHLFSQLENHPLWEKEIVRLRLLQKNGRLGSILGFFLGNLDRNAPGQGTTLVQKGIEKGLFTSIREGYFRVAVHGWHDGNDIDHLVEWLKEWKF